MKGELAERHSRHAARAANALSDLHSEIAVMRALRHRNIVTLLEVCHPLTNHSKLCTLLFAVAGEAEMMCPGQQNIPEQGRLHGFTSP